MRQWRQRAPFIVERAEEFELIDAQGARLIDGVSSLWCNVHGHCAPEIDRAIRAQLDRVAHSTLLGLSASPAIQLAAELVRIANAVEPERPSGKLEQVFLSDAGATATEAAFKMAIGAHFHRGAAQRNTFIALSGGYHGDTVGAMSVGFIRAMHAPFEPLTFQCVRVQAPDPRHVSASLASDPNDWPTWDERRCALAKRDALNALDRALDDHGDHIAAMVIEPVMQGAAGMVAQPAGYLSGAAHRVRDAGAWLIADEVATGFARTGAMFACEHERVRPDILCLAKGLSGGYLPIAATLATREISESFEGDVSERKTLYHGHTFTGNALACAASRASLDLLERNNIVARSRAISDRICAALRAALATHPHVGDVRNSGVMTGVELVAQRNPWTYFPTAVAAAPRVCDEARQRGLFIRPIGDTVIVNPAPAMDDATLDRALASLIDAINAVDYTKNAPDALSSTPAGAS